MAAAPDPPTAGEAATASRDWAQKAAPLLVAWTSRSAFFRRWRRPVGWRGWRWERIGAFLLAILAAVPLIIAHFSPLFFICAMLSWIERRVQPSRRSEEHTSELQSLIRISSAVFCFKKKNNK